MDNLSLSLQITLIGMGLVFGAIILLWIMMAVLVRLTPDREAGKEPTDEAAAIEPSTTDRAVKQRAAIAAVAEPRLIRDPEAARIAVDVVDRVTTLLTGMEERRSDEFRVLRQALGYCWSVVTAASPTKGKALMEVWAGSADRDVRWILRENLKKARLVRLDPEWVAALGERLT
jgi:Na+-transporting methylmalonyl-CoA/oxaloacetate decarboxylase gamma subunit